MEKDKITTGKELSDNDTTQIQEPGLARAEDDLELNGVHTAEEADAWQKELGL